MNRKSTHIPEPVAQLQRQLDQFRSTQSTRTKLPQPLWQEAAELARQHGVYAVAHPVRLGDRGMKRRVGGARRPRRKGNRPAFVELVAPRPATRDECVSEFAASRGGKMRIQWKASASP